MPILDKYCVVYAIRAASGHYYIGSTYEFTLRMKQHFHLLKRGEHHCKKLQHLYAQLGDEAFSVIPLAEVERSKLRLYEKRYLRAHADDPLMLNTQLW